MQQNIKVDIIYYLSGTDFEMEFNLCGCCRMRLLTDRVSDGKSFVNSLARAVSRSRVIICCGPLFGANGLISQIAKSIGKELEVLNSKSYGLNSNDEIKIVKGATPLITKDGSFGGFIIESGPQTIIALSESKNIRKSLMNNLIHPYIEELSVSPITHIVTNTAEAVDEPKGQPFTAELEISENPAGSDGNFEAQDNSEETDIGEETDGTETAEPEQEEISQEEAETTDAENNAVQDGNEEEKEAETDLECTVSMEPEAGDSSFVLESEDDSIEAPDIIEKEAEMFIEPQRITIGKINHYAQNYVPSESDNMFLAATQEENKRKRNEHNLNIALIVILALILVLILVLAYFLVIIPIKSGYDISWYINNIFGLTG